MARATCGSFRERQPMAPLQPGISWYRIVKRPAMKILITGGSSFTGYWFIKELAARGHAITAVVRGNKDQYSGLRKARIEQVAGWADIAWNCSFGDDTFLQLLDNGYDAVCHHGAQVEN